MEKNTNAIRELILECMREVFTEAVKPGTEQDVRGVLGRPFDDHIVAGSVQVDDHEVKDGSKTSEGYTYSWKLLIPVDDPNILTHLDESQETFEEKLIEAITKRLRSPAEPGGQYTTGFAEVESRQDVRGKKFLLIKVEMTVAWDV
jgi:hypothetical protein